LAAFENKDWDTYEKEIVETSSGMFALSSECLSYTLFRINIYFLLKLFRLDIPYDIYRMSVEQEE